MTSNITIAEVVQLLRHHDNYAILAHRRPDGDAVGSAIALCLALREIGKSAVCLCSDPIPPGLTFVPNADCFVPHDSAKNFHYIISVDTASSEQLGELAPAFGDKVNLSIDHHASGAEYAARTYVEPRAASCTEIIFDIAQALGAQSLDIYTAIFVGLIADTGCFRHTNVTARTFEVAAAISAMGVDTHHVTEMCYNNRPVGGTRALAHALATVERIGFATLVMFTNADKIRLEMDENDTSEVAEFLREETGVLLSIVLSELPEGGKYRLSTRSRAPVDCAAFCRNFGGGGHLRAAGGTVIATSAEEALGAVRSQIRALGGDE